VSYKACVDLSWARQWSDGWDRVPKGAERWGWSQKVCQRLALIPQRVQYKAPSDMRVRLCIQYGGACAGSHLVYNVGWFLPSQTFPDTLKSDDTILCPLHSLKDTIAHDALCTLCVHRLLIMATTTTLTTATTTTTTSTTSTLQEHLNSCPLT